MAKVQVELNQDLLHNKVLLLGDQLVQGHHLVGNHQEVLVVLNKDLLLQVRLLAVQVDLNKDLLLEANHKEAQLQARHNRNLKADPQVEHNKVLLQVDSLQVALHQVVLNKSLQGHLQLVALLLVQEIAQVSKAVDLLKKIPALRILKHSEIKLRNKLNN